MVRCATAVRKIALVLIPVGLLAACGDDFALSDELGEGGVAVADDLALEPAELEIVAGDTHAFSAAGGFPPYAFSATGGSIDPEDGSFTAPEEADDVTVTVRDSAGNEIHADVVVYSVLRIVHDSETVRSEGTVDFDAEGGDGAYAFSVVSGEGEIDSSTGVYTAPRVFFDTVTATVQVSDDFGQTAQATVRVRGYFSWRR